MKSKFITLLFTLLLVFCTFNGLIFAESNNSKENGLTITQTNALNSLFKEREDSIKSQKNQKNSTSRDEALGLVNLMDDVHAIKLSDYKTDYIVKDIAISQKNQIVTADLYQSFTWIGQEVVTEFKDEIIISFVGDNEVDVVFPQMDITVDDLVTNAHVLNKKAQDEISENLEYIKSDTLQPLSSLQSITYDRTKVKEYVDTYWSDYNPVYNSYAKDCTNFASQAIHAGGIPMYIAPNGTDYNPSWYYNINANGWLRSISWINVDHLFDLLRNYNTINATASNLAGMWIGDIIQYDRGSTGDKDHTAIVSYIETPNWDPSRRYTYVSYHTKDRHNVSWDFYPSSYTNTSSYFTHIENNQ